MRIALATVGTAGDVRPFAVLARALVERGHAVTAVTWPVHRAALSGPGIRVELAGPHVDPARIEAVAAEAAGQGPMEQVAILRDFHLADGEAHLRRLREVLPGHNLVVLHGIHALAHAAVLDEGLPWASAVFDPVLLPTATAPPPGLPNLGPANRLAWKMLDVALGRVSRPLDDVLARSGSHQRGLPLFRARSDLLHLVACSPSIVRVPSDLPAGTSITGAWIDRSAPAPLPMEIETFLAAGAEPIVVTFGSMRGIPADELRAAVDLLIADGRRVIVQGPLGGGDDPPRLLRAGSVDHRALFPRAALVIHHGGAGTTHAVVTAGVPSVVVPHVGDQRYWADRLCRLGVASRPIRLERFSPRELATAATATADDVAARGAAHALAARVAVEDGVGVTCSLIERAIGRAS